MASSARIDELRKKFEENPRRYFAPLANEYRKAGEIEQAISICREYLPQQPGHMSGHIVYGQALYEARQFEEAKTVFETALSLDPENLIALRHLGDIALIIGDTDGARGWYRRVLEADPRNEEIQSQLKTLDQAAASPAASAPTPATTPALTAPAPAPASAASGASAAKPAGTKPTPSSAPTVVVSAVRDAPAPAKPQPAAAAAPPPAAPAPAGQKPVQQPRPPVTAESPTAEALIDAAPQTVAAVPQRINAPTDQALELESPVAGASADAPPINGFSLEGLETTSLSTTPAVAAPSPPVAELPELDLAVAVAEPAPRPAKPAEAAPVPDLELSEPVDDTPASSPVADLPMLDLGEEVTPATPEPPAQASDAGPFVTETMAELYLQQGHRLEALRVYRALVAQRPGDMSLRAKLYILEAELTAPPAPPRAAPPAPASEPRRYTPVLAAPTSRAAAAAAAQRGPTIREVLSLVAMRRPGFRPEAPQQNGAPARTAPAPERPAPVPGADAASYRIQSLGPDAIGALFGSARISAADEGAAVALALAFVGMNGGQGSPPEPASRAIAGTPAHPAATELSLDSVFGTGQAPQAAPASFSFDQFFSARATAEHSTGPDAGADRGASQADVAQFTQWLEGLKQR
jgi:tetratricopeptide (TPR) repeat protein